MSIRKIIATGLMAAYLTAASLMPAKAANVSLEGTYGLDDKGKTTSELVTIDTKVSGPLIDNKLNYFCRSRVGINYDMPEGSTQDNQVSTTSLVRLLVPLNVDMPGKLSLIGEVKLNPGAEADPRLGFDYTLSEGPLFFDFIPTRNLGENPYTDLFFLGRYAPQEKDKLNPYIAGEGIAVIGDKQFTSALARIRIGASYNGWRFGASDDISGIGSGEEINHSVGVFIGKNF
jgi:hypothetical protein